MSSRLLAVRTICLTFLDQFRLHTKQDPDQDVSGNNGGQGEGNTDLEEVTVGNFVAFLTQDADTGDVGGSTDGVQLPPRVAPDSRPKYRAVESMPISIAIPAMTGIMVAT